MYDNFLKAKSYQLKLIFFHQCLKVKILIYLASTLLAIYFYNAREEWCRVEKAVSCQTSELDFECQAKCLKLCSVDNGWPSKVYEMETVAKFIIYTDILAVKYKKDEWGERADSIMKPLGCRSERKWVGSRQQRKALSKNEFGWGVRHGGSSRQHRRAELALTSGNHVEKDKDYFREEKWKGLCRGITLRFGSRSTGDHQEHWGAMTISHWKDNTLISLQSLSDSNIGH